MLIKLSGLIEKYNLKIKGVIHIGAHWGQEYEEYKECGIQDHVVFVEPASKAYAVLVDKFASTPGVNLFNCALGAEEGEAEMNIEVANKGMSNSLLKPLEHLEQYPNITFNETEKVNVRKLDNLPINVSNYNFINIDVQGFEMQVFLGGLKTLMGIDYIMTEVNSQELYEHCVRVNELDSLLKDFCRIETLWVKNKGWGDALYIRKSLLE